ncbi:TIGR03089 family protein [Mycobacterium sp.]|uniref:TIGR03089 family protein n=1 Tax=Mycobacterium sp. TaxID=1785 RepID=UPI003A8A4230
MPSLITLSGAILDPLLREDPAGPRITYYDDACGERIELSAATLANWAAKTGNLLRDELGAGPGSRVGVLLPAHWQTAAVLFGVWWIGAEAVLDGPADVALCTGDRLDQADASVAAGDLDGAVAVLSLDPFGKPAPDLPFGVLDYATAVRVHGDQILPEARPGPALAGQSVAQLVAACAQSAGMQGLAPADRVLSCRPWSRPEHLVDGLLAVLSIGGSLVQVANPDSELLPRRIETEKVTRVL